MVFKELTKVIKINGHSIKAWVTIEVHDDEDLTILLDQNFESKERENEYRAKLENGEVFCGTIVVKASALGLEGSDVLGGCELVPNNMFNSKPFDQSVERYLEGDDMLNIALSELTMNLKNEYNQLVKRAEEYRKYSVK